MTTSDTLNWKLKRLSERLTDALLTVTRGVYEGTNDDVLDAVDDLIEIRNELDDLRTTNGKETAQVD